jgi:hypothetical protein
MVARAWAMVAVLGSAAALTGFPIAAPPAIIPASDGAQTAGRLTVVLDAGKTSYALYEPVVVTFRVVNPTDTAIRTSLTMDYGQGISLTIQREGGGAEAYQSGLSTDVTRTSEARFEGHSTDAGEVVALFNDRVGHLAFPAAGRYKLSVSAQVWIRPGVLIESNPVWIEVREPSEIDRRAIDSLGSPDGLVSLFRHGVKEFCRGEQSLDTCAQNVRSVLRRYPESAYAPALTYYYGLDVAARDLPIGPEDEPATDIFDGFLRRWAGHPFEADVTAALIREVHARGRREESFEWLHRFEKKFPERSSQLHELRARIER